ncbi:MAG: IS66 family transposase [Candidatus Acidiferrales bacterium]
MIPRVPADLSQLSPEQKDALIIALLARIEGLAAQVAALQAENAALSARVAELEARLGQPPKTPDNSGTPPSRGQKRNQPARVKREGPRAGSLGRQGGGRKLAAEPDQFVTATPTHCRHCGTVLQAGDHVLHGRYDKIDLPPVRPVVTRVERYAGRCPGCGGVTVAPVPEGLEEGTPFGPGIVAAALYLRYVHAISYQRLARLFRDLFGVAVSEGALDSLFQRAKPHVDREVAVILARLRRSRVICSDETTVRINGRTCWNWVFQNAAVVIHVVRPTRAAAVVNEVLDGHRPSFWVSDLYGGQQGHADLWQVCLAHQLRDCQYAIEAGDALFAPRMKTLLLRAVVLACRRHDLAASTRREYRRRLERDLDAIMALAPENRHGKRLRKRYAKVRDHLFTFLDHPEVPPDNNGSERELRPTATYRKVTGGFRSGWGADLFAGIKSVLGTAARHGLDAYQAIRQTLCGHSILDPG